MTSNVRTDLVIDPNGDIWTDARLQRYINEFQGLVYSWTGLDFGETSGTLTLVDGTATYNLSTGLSNYGKFISIRLTGRYNTLPEVNIQELENEVDLTFEGEPVEFYLYGDDTLGLWPVPDGVIVAATVRFERSGPTLTSSDSPACDDNWHHVYEKYAMWRALDTQPGFEDRARQAKVDYQLWAQQMKDDIWERTTGTRQMRNEITTLWPA